MISSVHLSQDHLKDSILKHPSLLQYSLNSLRSKCTFLTNEIDIPEKSLARVVKLAPVTLGLSLEENLIPTVATLKERCDLSSKELGEIVLTCPTILSLSLKRKIEPCLYFLTANLYISSPRELGNLIKCTPRILLQGVDTSLARKLVMMQGAIKKSSNAKVGGNHVEIETASIFKRNPALLATTNTILQRRIEESQKKTAKDIALVFAKKRTGRKRKFDPGEQVTTSTMTEMPIHDSTQYQRQQKPLFDKNFSQISISAFVSGSIYPPDDIKQARGKRKSGGIAIMLPQLRTEKNHFDFESAMKKSFGMIMPKEEGGSNPDNAVVLVGFPFLRPSRNRANLYAVHGALKVVLQLLNEVSTKRDMKHTKTTLDIYTDSSYAWKLLKNSTQLENWGSFSSVDDFVFDGVGSVSMANRDILFPLAKNVHIMINKQIISRSGEKINFGDLEINFLFSGSHESNYNYMREINSYSKKAAKWQFEKG